MKRSYLLFLFIFTACPIPVIVGMNNQDDNQEKRGVKRSYDHIKVDIEEDIKIFKSRMLLDDVAGCEELIEKGFDINQEVRWGSGSYESFVLRAAKNNQPEMLQMFFGAGAILDYRLLEPQHQRRYTPEVTTVINARRWGAFLLPYIRQLQQK
jgi:hypothetical protein